MKKRTLALPLALVALLAFMGTPGHALSSATVSDTTSDGLTIEPILVKADAQVGLSQFRTNALSMLNITSVQVVPNGTKLTFNINVKTGIPLTAADAATIAPPYGGGDVLVQFQVKRTQESATNVGCVTPYAVAAPCQQQEKWTPVYQDDRQYYFIHYSIAGNTKTVPGIPDYEVSFGAYDPSGVVQPPIGPGVGQLWTTYGRDHSLCQDAVVSTNNAGQPWPFKTGVTAQPNAGNNIDVAFSNYDTGHGPTDAAPRARTISLSMPYTYRWLTNSTCLFRQKEIVIAGDRIENLNGFSWALHLLGAGVGPAVGYTWYTDAAPGLLGAPGVTSTGYGYKAGTPAGDPNPPSVRSYNCPQYEAGVETNPLANGQPCMISNPTGPGFKASGVTAIA